MLDSISNRSRHCQEAQQRRGLIERPHQLRLLTHSAAKWMLKPKKSCLCKADTANSPQPKTLSLHLQYEWEVCPAMYCASQSFCSLCICQTSSLLWLHCLWSNICEVLLERKASKAEWAMGYLAGPLGFEITNLIRWCWNIQHLWTYSMGIFQTRC